MSFREKSAWLMGAVMLLTGMFYAWIVAQAPDAPVFAPLIPYVLLVTILSIAVQVTLAISSPKEASLAADERERPAIDRAGNWSGIVLATGIVLAGGAYVLHPSGTMLFHHILGALVIAQISEYGFQLYLFRRSA